MKPATFRFTAQSLEILAQFKKSIDLIGNQTRDLSAWNAMRMD
jgi:hypothetical protein